jgi:acetyl-CoA carboxylase carboxyl transferase subunit alpha
VSDTAFHRGPEFEKPILERLRVIQEKRNLLNATRKDSTPELIAVREKEIQILEDELTKTTREIFAGLTPWQKVQLARHPQRPLTEDFITRVFEGFLELHGDRCFADDKAIITGFARLDRFKVMIVGHKKGRDTKDNLQCNFGCAHPEGYRKALHKMQLAARFKLPIITFVNTPGAYPGIGAEERGQAWAIAENIMEMSALPVPIIVVVIGEGGSGGALGIGVGDRVLIFEHAYYSVISPEGCAAILWKSGDRAPDAAKALRLTADDLLSFGVVDGKIPEPFGGAHRDHAAAAANLRVALLAALGELTEVPPDRLLEDRYRRLRNLGRFFQDAV